MSGALKMYALCEIVFDITHRHEDGSRTVSSLGRVRILDEFDDQGTAETAARRHTIDLAGEENMMVTKTVTVIPVWRVT